MQFSVTQPTIMWSLLVVVIALVIVFITHLVYRWRKPIIKVKLPPGSMGLPFIGETLQLFATQTSFDIHPFIKKKMNKHGPIFKTNLAARPIVISTDPEFSHFVFLQEGISTETYVPFLESSRELFESKNLNIHKYLRNMVLDYFGTEKQKERLVGEMEDMVRKKLEHWSKQPSVELKEASASMAFGYASKKLLSYDPSKYSENLKDAFIGFLRGLMKFPLNIPGTAYHKCLKDRKKVMAALKEIVTERLNSSNNQQGDFLDVMIGEMRSEEPVFEIEGATYIVFALMLASFETISLMLTLAIKFISEHPAVLKEFSEEHEKILKNRENVDSPITWNDYKSMTFTANILDETLRLGNISQLIYRRAKKDIEVNGYTIPAGWGIVVYPPAIHLNPDKYKDPLQFNPWRWKGQGSNTASKNFMPFGGGCRLCAGAGYTKLQISIVLHLLATKYRWTKVKGGEVIQKIGVVFQMVCTSKLLKTNKCCQEHINIHFIEKLPIYNMNCVEV